MGTGYKMSEKISRSDLRLLIETELRKPENKSKPRVVQAKMFELTKSQYNNYINHGFVNEAIIQKLGSYFGKTVDNSEFAPASRQFTISESEKDKATTTVRKSAHYNQARRDEIEAHISNTREEKDLARLYA